MSPPSRRRPSGQRRCARRRVCRSRRSSSPASVAHPFVGRPARRPLLGEREHALGAVGALEQLVGQPLHLVERRCRDRATGHGAACASSRRPPAARRHGFPSTGRRRWRRRRWSHASRGPWTRASLASNGSPVSIADAMRLAGTRRRMGTEMIAAATPMRTSVNAKVVDRGRRRGRTTPSARCRRRGRRRSRRRSSAHGVSIRRSSARTNGPESIGPPSDRSFRSAPAQNAGAAVREHDRSGIGGLGAVERVVQFGEQLPRECVAVRLRVERDRRDAVGDVEIDDVVHRHGP